MTRDDHEDPALLERMRQGDRDALATVFAQHRERLHRMIVFRLHPKLLRRVDPDDVLQDAWFDAVQRIGSYADQDDPSGYLWLRLILGQTLVDLHRKHLGAQKRALGQEVPIHRHAGPHAHSATISIQLAAGHTSPSGIAVRAENARLLEELLDGMDGIDREILVLRHFEEVTNSEAARILDIQPSAASNRYIRALGRLRVLAERVDGLGEPPKQDP